MTRFQPREECFVIEKEGETQVGNRKVADHLRELGGSEAFANFRIYDYPRIHHQIRNQGIHHLAFIAYVKLPLLLGMMTVYSKFDNEGILVSLLVQTRLKRIEDFHARANNFIAQFRV